jgi:hypothetical protein
MAKDVVVTVPKTSVTVERSETTPSTVTSTEDDQTAVAASDITQTLVQNPIRPLDIEDRLLIQGATGPTGPAGPSTEYGPEGPRGVGPALTYTGTRLDRVDYDAGDYKLLTYTGAQLNRVDWVMYDKIIRKDLVYSGTQLVAVNQSILPPL